MPVAKPIIKYVVISDTHFGAATSLLTNVKLSTGRPHPVKPTPVLEHLVKCLNTLIPEGPLDTRPTLILNGDIFELALSEMNLAALAFLRFAELIFPPNRVPLFSRIIFLPGNHDHHLWEMARETQYLNYMSAPRRRKYPDAPWHATTLFLDGAKPADIPPAQFLMALLQGSRRFDCIENIPTFYPNLGLLSDDGKKCVIVHHGHFTERVYYLMSTVKTMLFPKRLSKGERPPHVWDIEAENFAWIDFLWSTLGRSGKVGSAVDLVFELLHSDKGRKYLVSRLSKGIAADACAKYVPDISLSAPLWVVLTILLGLAAGEMESKKASKGRIPLDPNSQELLKYYIETPLRSQIRVSPRPGRKRAANPEMPEKVTFLFGHTHKPFQSTCTCAEYNSPVVIHNMGGWIVEKASPDQDYGGAAIFADADLNTAQVEFYHEAAKGAASVAVVPGPAGANSLVKHLQGLVNPALNPWAAFTAEVGKDLANRRKILKAQQTPPAPTATPRATPVAPPIPPPAPAPIPPPAPLQPGA